MKRLQKFSYFFTLVQAQCTFGSSLIITIINNNHTNFDLAIAWHKPLSWHTAVQTK